MLGTDSMIVRAIFILDTCCCCFSLETGALLIGFLSLFSDLALSIVMMIGLVASRVTMKHGSTEEAQTIGGIIFVVLLFDLVVVIINLFFTIMLLIGIHYQTKRHYVRMYLIASTISVIINIIIFPSSIATGAEIRNIIVDFVSIVLNVYALLVIRSFLKQEESDRRSLNSEMA